MDYIEIFPGGVRLYLGGRAVQLFFQGEWSGYDDGADPGPFVNRVLKTASRHGITHVLDHKCHREPVPLSLWGTFLLNK